MRSQPSDHLLRVLGTLPVESRILDLGCGDGRHTEALVRLGFDVFGCDSSPEAVDDLRSHLGAWMDERTASDRIVVARPDTLGYPDDFFDWVIAYQTLARGESRREMLDILAEVRRVLRPGGWIYVVVPAISGLSNGSHGYAGDSGMDPTFTPRTLDDLLFEADFVTAERPSMTSEGDDRIVHAIYRKVDADTPV